MVDDQLELRRLQDRQIRRFHTLEDTAGVVAELTERLPQARSVAY